MKLYIPTCTLNFNNIFATESISPNSFYLKRGFGNKRFYSVKPNNRENEILLYSKYPLFETEHSDLENFPLVIEIETGDLANSLFEKVKELDGVEVFACSKTIYLNPFHCFVYFRSYSDLQATLSKAEQSLENKFSNLYRNNFVVKQTAKKSWYQPVLNLFSNEDSPSFVWSSKYSEISCSQSIDSIEDDLYVDRVKGFLYCYLIGAIRGTSPEVAKLKSIARKLRNTVSAVVNSPDRRPTNIQDEAILNLIIEFNQIYSQNDEDCSYNTKLLHDYLSSNPANLDVKKCETLLKHYGVYDIVKSKLQLRRVYDASDVWTCIEYGNSETFNRVFETMNNAISRIEQRVSEHKPKLPINELVSVLPEFVVSITDKSYKTDFYERLINSQLKAEYQNVMNENGVEEPLAQAFNGGSILKTLMGDNWEKSTVSTYIKSLLSHFQENTAFDLFACDNDVISSFAAFCQKGDNIDRLSEYLVSCGFSNYKLAYGIYGATRGFASLPKTFTSTLINGDREYCKNVCIEMFQLLHGITLCNADFPLPQAGTIDLHSNPIGGKILEHMEAVEPNPKKRDSVVSAVSQAIELEDAVQSPKAFMYILDSFPRIKTTKAYKALEKARFEEDRGEYTIEGFRERIYSIIGSKDLKSQKEKIDKAIELEAKRQDPDAFLNILDNFLSPTDQAYKRIKKLIQPSSTKRNSPPEICSLPYVHKSQRIVSIRSRLLIEDVMAITIIEQLNFDDSSLKKKILENFKDFIKGYQPGGFYYKNEHQYRRNNYDVIEHFVKWCFSDKNRYNRIEWTQENQKEMERVKSILKKFYPE